MNDDAPAVGDCSPADDVPVSGDWDSAARVARLLDVVQRYAVLDFSEDAPVGLAGDDLDALAAGINMLGEELHGWNLDFEQRVDERTHQVTAASERLVAEVAERRRAEAQLARANTELIEHVGHLRQLNEQIEQLTEMANLLQTVSDTPEAFDVVGRFAPEIFDEASGAVYRSSTTREHASLVTAWGTSQACVPTIQFEDCEALRHGRAHRGHDAAGDACSHRRPNSLGQTLCVPLASHSEVLGLLTLDGAVAVPPHDGAPRGDPGGSLFSAYERLALAVRDQLGLTLTNLELRTELRTQAIRDALTGLYNRRHLDEALTRELHRSQRVNLPVSVLMIDIDHFKAFNDTYGHTVGDAVLADVAGILRDRIRVEDIACRYGGEEFAIIMAGLDLAEAADRAEEIRRRVAQHDFIWRDLLLGHLTVSIGIATHPRHGDGPDRLLRSADAALYRAKEGGRNRVEIAT
jgi:diguanylate cyclase (GGDEF)-like protein